MSAGRVVWTGAVLTGGAGRRFGQDKALVRVRGVALATRVATALQRAGAGEVLLVGGDASSRQALTGPTTHFVADRWPGEGPLGGIISALEASRSPVLVVLPCDLLEPRAELAEVLVEALLAGPHDVAVPIDTRGLQVHATAWRSEARRELRRTFASGVRSVREACTRLSVCAVADVDPTWLADADEPRDLAPDGGASQESALRRGRR